MQLHVPALTTLRRRGRATRALAVSCAAGVVAAALATVTNRARMTEALVDRAFRRPRGQLARRWWRRAPGHGEIFDDVLAACRFNTGDRLLEVGCGGGTFLTRALQTAASAVGCDHSADMLTVATEANHRAVVDGRVRFALGTAESLPFDDAEFTIVASMNMFFFVEDPAAALSEFARVLRPEGRLVLHTVMPDPPARVVPSFVERRMRGYTDEELAALAVDAGFDAVDIEHPRSPYYQLLRATRRG